MAKPDPKKIKTEVRRTVQRIRTYCRSQRKLWMEIPYLALDADGRTGFSDQYQDAFHSQLWRITVPGTQAWVCLYTGRIVSIDDTSQLASPDVVIQFAQHLELLDARKIAAELRREAEAPVASYITPRTKADLHRIRKQLEWVPRRGPLQLQFD